MSDERQDPLFNQEAFRSVLSHVFDVFNAAVEAGFSEEHAMDFAWRYFTWTMDRATRDVF